MVYQRPITFCLAIFILVAGAQAAGEGVNLLPDRGVERDAAEELELVRDGQARATILLAAQPRAAAQLAAFELQHTLEKISGAKLPLVREPAPVTGLRILVGESQASAELGYRNEHFGPQEYLVKTFPDTLLLIGHDADRFGEVAYDDYGSLYRNLPTDQPLATCYAVSDFLEKVLSVRWYYPNDEIGETVPRRPTVRVKALDRRRRPDTLVRQIYPLFTNTQTLYFNDFDEPTHFRASWVDARQSWLYWLRHKVWGGLSYNANHSFVDYDVAFGQDHPDWFSPKSVEKMHKLDYQSSVQPCFSAPGFFEQVVHIADDYFRGKEAAYRGFIRSAAGDFFSVMPNDNVNMCRCPACQAQYRLDVSAPGQASHYVWGFLNRVAREVRQSHPDAKVSCCAYFNYTNPPEGLILEPNVAVTFCKFYEGYWDRRYQENDYALIQEWVTKNQCQFFTTWEYLLHPWYTEWAFPCMLPHVHAEDVKRLKDLGFRGGNLQYLALTTYHDDGQSAGGIAWASPVLDFMNLYWRVKLYDEASLDIDEALKEYYQQFFGPAAGAMEKFYTALETRWMDPEVRRRTGAPSTGGAADNPRVWWGYLGTEPFLNELAGYVQEARAKTEAESVYRQRVDLIEAGVLGYMRKAREKYETSAMFQFAPLGTAGVAFSGRPAGAADWADDSTWRDSIPCEIATTHLNAPAARKTLFQLAYDPQYWYLHARCFEPDPQSIRADTQENDDGGLFSDDSLEVFIDPEGRGVRYYQITINAAGYVYDAEENPLSPGATANVAWSSGARVRAAIKDGYWEIRAAFPLANLVRANPSAFQTWRFNLCRNHPGQPDAPFSAWSPTLGGFHNPGRFGVITFDSRSVAPRGRGRVVWACDFESPAFATETGASPLIGVDGWFETLLYANRGWDQSWQVLRQGDNHLAVGDINNTNTSDLVPRHSVQVLPGTFSVEVDYRRQGLEGNFPTLQVNDAQGRSLVYTYVWPDRGDLVAIEQQNERRNYGEDDHRLGKFADPGKWFGLKSVIDTRRKEVTVYVRSGRGEWVPLNRTPLPYYDPQADGTQLTLGFGSRKERAAVPNVLEMDNIRVMQWPDPNG